LTHAEETNYVGYARLQTPSGDPIFSLGTIDGATTYETLSMKNGNVGIGTDSPVSTLDVKTSGVTILTANTTGFTTAGDGTGFGVYRSNTGRQSGYSWTIDSAAESGGADASEYQIDSIAFNIRKQTTDSSLSEVMRIDSSGNVGIGQSSPDTKLDVKAGATATQDDILWGVQINNEANGAATNYGAGLKFKNSSISEPYKWSGIAGVAGSGYSNATDLAFYASSNSTADAVERMRITGGGNLLVGATANTDVSNLTLGHLLEAYSANTGLGAVGTYNNSGTANCPSLVVLNRDTSTDSTNVFMRFYANVTSSGATSMGGIVGNGANNVQFAALSDIREKENIKTIKSSLDKISKLNPVEFDWKKTGEHINAGFIAQEVEEIFPEYVVENTSNEGEEERKGLTGGMTSGIVAHLVKAIQELKADNDSLKARIETLENN